MMNDENNLRSTMSTAIQSSLADGILEIMLDRPERLNSFNEEMHLALRESLERGRDDDTCRAILLTGNGRGFCAGQDLDARDQSQSQGPPDLSQSINEFYNPLIRLLRSINKPVVCAVNGVAAGAGANVALACDIVIAAESARFIQSFAKIGLIPDAGGSWSLPRLIGEARAKAIAMTADPVSAKQAEQWGMIYKTVADEELMPTARKLARQLADGPTFGLGLMKEAIQSAAGNTLDQQLELEAQLQGQCGRSPDFAEGVSAFLQKRAATFSGRSS